MQSMGRAAACPPGRSGRVLFVGMEACRQSRWLALFSLGHTGYSLILLRLQGGAPFLIPLFFLLRFLLPVIVVDTDFRCQS